MATEDNYMVVVAMDFGTTFSGYAYSFKSDYNTDPKKISCNTKWGTGTNEFGSLKTPTVILLKWNKDVGDFKSVEFGYDAENKYTELVEADEHEDYVLVDRFKMKLYSESAASALTENTTIKLADGKKFKAIRLISMFIEYLKDHFFKSIAKRGLKLKDNEIRWVLTVPAIWTDGAKQFMRKAAERAGICSSKLRVVYEPEAAALCCANLSDPRAQGSQLFESGRRCIVIDAGGGTVDFTIHEVSDSSKLVVCHEASGGPWGGTTVDRAFQHIFIELFGKEVFNKFATECREDLYALARDFEYKKRSIRTDQKQVTIRFPSSLKEKAQECDRRSIDMVISESIYKDKVKVVKDKIRFDTQLLISLFKKPRRRIVNHVKELLKTAECKDAKTILLVGGFGSAEPIQQSIKDNFPNMTTIIPEDPELAVLKGAVLFGHNPSVIKSRVAKYSYGVETTRDFKEGIDPESKRAVFDGIDKCTDIFSRHVQKGQELRTGEPTESESYSPVAANQTAMAIKIFASTDKDPQFVTDDSCTYIGEIEVDMSDTTDGRDRNVLVELSFAETEIEVKAVVEKTNESVTARVNFLG